MRCKKRILLVLVLVVLNAYAAAAIGLRGTNFKPFFFYESGAQYESNYDLLTGGASDFSYRVTDDSNLSQYVSFDPPELRRVVGQSVPVSIRVRFPEGELALAPGPHTINVVIEEGRGSAGGLSARGGVWVPITIFRAYPGKFLSPSLEADNANENEPVHVRVKLRNYGDHAVENAYAVVEIFDAFGVSRGKVTTDGVSIGLRDTEMISAVFMDTKGWVAGTYTAKAMIYYDAETTSAEGTFRIGSYKLSLVDFTKEFPVGRISKFFVTVKSDFAGRIENVRAELVLNERFRTEAVALDPFGQGTLMGFLDAGALTAGVYDATLRVLYGEQVLEQPVKITVKDTVKPGIKLSKTAIILLAVNILLAVLIWYVLRRRRAYMQ